MIEPLTEKQQALAEGGVGAVRAMTIKYKLRSPWLEDEIDSAAMLGLVNAAATFDPRAGRAWTGWLIWHVAGQMRELFRKSNRYAERFKQESRHCANLLDPDDECHLDRMDRAEQVSHLLELTDVLPKRQQELCRLVYQEGMSLTEASRKLGITKQGAASRHSKAIQRLRAIA